MRKNPSHRPLRTASLVVASLAVALTAAACSLLVDFDPEGKPCGKDGACLEGYACVADKCVKSTATDGGTTGADAGPTDECGGRCTSDQRCLASSHTCVDKGCASTVCPAGQICAEQTDGSPQCMTVTDGPNKSCTTDADCPGHSGAICLVGSTGRGFCTFVCGTVNMAGVDDTVGCNTWAGGSSMSPLAGCYDVSGAKLCVRRQTKNDAPVLFGCHGDDTCAQYENKICAVFDMKLPASGGPPVLKDPVLVCDEPVTSTVKLFDACSDTNLPRNGLCIPGPGHSTSAYATQACESDTDCDGDGSAGGKCVHGEYAKTGFAPRQFTMCQKDDATKKHACDECTTDADCDATTPHCAAVSSTSKKHCLQECKTFGVTAYNCAAADGVCTPVGAGATAISVCVPTSKCGDM